MFNRGKLVLLAMVLVGLGAASFAFWFRYERGKRTIDLWGSDAVLLVRDAEVVELLVLRPADASAVDPAALAAAQAQEAISVAGEHLHVDEQIDISQARGLVHLRHALVQDEKSHDVAGVAQILPQIHTLGKQGMEVKRFKGLGEMNSEELWETTLDPNKRTLLRVTLQEAGEAERMFSVLMGEDVERRRQFIEEHALEVKNLDV